MRSDVRKQVMARIIQAMADAVAADASVDPFKAARRMFPDVPIEVITEAWLELEERKVEAWWQAVEKTIEGEIIERAIAAPKGG